jgi:ABC-type protease/lipase transport system fused ATPase/permease subunit
VAAPIRGIVTAAYVWAPAIAIYVLLGFAVGWWFPTIIVAAYAILIAWALVYRRRRKRDVDSAARRAHEEQVYRRSVRWVKIWGLLLAGMMLALLVLALVVVVVERA